MPLKAIIFILIAVLCLVFIVIISVNIAKHRKELKDEPGNLIILAIYTFAAQFMSSFGFPEYAVSTVFYHKLKMVEDKKLPGTLNTAASIPIAVVSLAYMYTIDVNPLTLTACIITQLIGTLVGLRILSRIKTNMLRLFLGAALIASSIFIFGGKLGLVPTVGYEAGLYDGKLVASVILFLFVGLFTSMGFGMSPLAIAILYALGVNTASALTIVMAASAFGCILGGIKFVKRGEYSRKICLMSTIFGTAGVIMAVYIVKSLNITILQWIIAFIILYSGVTMLVSEIKQKSKCRNPV